MPINFANVNISLQQFQDIATGKFNAGDIRLTSATTLGKVNNHVSRRGANDVPLSHVEILAVKDAFVRALSRGGVGADEINIVRQELGLAPVGSTDTALASRSIRPLSRQQVRQIIDRNMDALVTHDPNLNIITDAANHINFSAQANAEIVRTRNEVNAALMRSRAILPDRRVLDVQNVISGNVGYAPPEDRARLIAVAESQKACILQGSNGHPSEAPGASLEYPIPGNGLTLTLPLGMSEKDYMRKLDDMLQLLRSGSQPSNATHDARASFRAAAAAGPEAAARWIAALAHDPQGAFKARTIAVGLLYDAGVDDFGTLSLLNRVSDFAALSFVSHLVNHGDPALRGDAMRHSPAVVALAQQVEPGIAIPEAHKAYIPAVSNAEVNGNILASLTNRSTGRPTHETETIKAEVRRQFEERFGADVFKAGTSFASIATAGHVTTAMSSLGDLATERFTPQQITDAIVREALPATAKVFLSKTLAPMLRAAGGLAGSSVTLATALCVRHPQLLARLVAAQTLEQARAVIDEFRPQIDEGIRRQKACDRFREEAKGVYRERLATAMGVPVSALEGRNAVNLKRLGVKGESLMSDIVSGADPADTDEQIRQAYRDIANAAADVRISLMRQAGTLGLPPEARDILKNQILTLDKVAGFNLATLKERADAIPIDSLILALSGDAATDTILAAMGAVGQHVQEAAIAVFNGQHVGGDEVGAAANLLLTLALSRRPEAFDMMRAFFARPDAAATNLVHLEGPAERAVAFQLFKPDRTAAETNAEIADTIARPGIAPVHTQALYLALDDLGLGDLPPDEKSKILAGEAGRALAKTVRSAAQPITPAQLRALAQTHLAKAAANAAIERAIAEVAQDEQIAPDVIAGTTHGILTRRNPDLVRTLAAALSGAAARGGNPSTAAKAILDLHKQTIIVALRSLDAIRAVGATAREKAVNEIAARANLDHAFVNAKLDISGLSIKGGSLDFLRGDIRDTLSNSATDIAGWNVADVAERARKCVNSFVAKKVAFLAQVDQMPLSDAARGNLVADALSYPPYKGDDLVGAVGIILRAVRETPVGSPPHDSASPLGRALTAAKAAFEYAKGTLTAEKIAEMPDDEIFRIFETVAAQLRDAIDAILPEERRAAMDNDDNAVIRGLLGMALADYCGESLLAAAARLAADGRTDAVRSAGDAIQRRYNSDYMTYASGMNEKREFVPVDEAKAAAANRSASNAAFGLRLLAAVEDAFGNEWLPTEITAAITNNSATPAQKALADAALRNAPALVGRIGEGLAPEKFARLKSFAIGLDYRAPSLAASEELLTAAANALRDAESVEAAEGRLAQLLASA